VGVRREHWHAEALNTASLSPFPLLRCSHRQLPLCRTRGAFGPTSVSATFTSHDAQRCVCNSAIPDRVLRVRRPTTTDSDGLHRRRRRACRASSSIKAHCHGLWITSTPHLPSHPQPPSLPSSHLHRPRHEVLRVCSHLVPGRGHPSHGGYCDGFVRHDV
jgi:hypothetical protein